MKRYHPHGDQSIYPTLVRMAQSWNLLGFDASRYDPIVEAPEA